MFKNLETKDFNTCFKLFKNDWALLAAGPLSHHNAMTVAWIGIGYLWRKNVAFVFVRPSRYTYEFTEKYDHFTLSFFDDKYHKELSYYGSNSGRDVNKDRECHFNPIEFDGVVSYDEASTVLVIKKIYADDIDPKLFIDSMIEDCYPDHSYHKMYICEIEKIYKKVEE